MLLLKWSWTFDFVDQLNNKIHKLWFLGNINETTVHVFAGSNKTSNERSWKQNAETLLETRFAARPADIAV